MAAKPGTRVDHVKNTLNGTVVDDYYELKIGDGSYSWERLKVNPTQLKELLEKIKEVLYAESS